MADFRPQTTIYLFKDTRVDALNQPYFTNEGAKMSWYFSHPSLSYTQYSYQREQRAYVRVNGKADQLREYDMLAWQNENNKWVLCNVLGVEFINPNCTEITFEVDYMQTYIENTQFRHCWVEREMQENDWDGTKPSWNNLQPEGIESGAKKRIAMNTSSGSMNLYVGGEQGINVVVLSVYDKDGEPNVSTTYDNGIPIPINSFIYRSTSMAAFNEMIRTYSDKGRLDGIVAVILCPTDVNSTKIEERTCTFSPTWNVIDGYTLINSKCFTSEFCHFELSNRQGESVNLQPEYFTEIDNIILKIIGGLAGGTGGALCYPQGYGSIPKSNGVTLKFDVQLAYVGNAFANWLAGNKGSLIGDLISGGVGSAVKGALVGSPGLGALSGVSAALQAATKIIDAAVDPLSASGSMSGNTIPYQAGNIGFTLSFVCPYYANIQVVDEFFSLYGYRTNRLKVPNVNTRPLWNYVKTAGAVVTGPFTHTAKIAMQNQLDNGVTFWHVPAATIGDYSDLAGNKSS